MEHLSHIRSFQEPIDLHPSGIINFPVENGIPITVAQPQFDANGAPIIDPATGLQVVHDVPRPPEDIQADAMARAELAAIAWRLTQVSLGLGHSPYSELRNELKEEHIAQAVANGIQQEQGQQLQHIVDHSHDPERVDAAQQTMDRLDDPRMSPAYQAKVISLQRAERAVANGTATNHVRQQVTQLRRELANMERDSRDAPTIGSTVGRLPRWLRNRIPDSIRDSDLAEGVGQIPLGRARRERTARGARQSMDRFDASTSTKADVLGASGRNLREDERRYTHERGTPQNIVSRKGAVLEAANLDHNPNNVPLEEGRRYVVMDTVSVPAQAFRPNDHLADPKGPTGKTAMLDPGGDGALHTIFINIAQPSPNNPNPTPQLIPMPRDDVRRGGSANQTLHGGPMGMGQSSDGLMYYEDGTVINPLEKVTVDTPVGAPLPPNAGKVTYPLIPDPHNPGQQMQVQRYEVGVIGPGSFEEKEDLVIIRPLLSGAEAIDIVLNGSNAVMTDPDHVLTDIIVRVSDLASLLTHNSIAEDENRVRTLNTHLIFDSALPAPPAGLRPPFDELVDTGYFRRYTHQNDTPVTQRQDRQQQHLWQVAQRRHIAGKAAQREKILQRIRSPRG